MRFPYVLLVSTYDIFYIIFFLYPFFFPYTQQIQNKNV